MKEYPNEHRESISPGPGERGDFRHHPERGGDESPHGLLVNRLISQRGVNRNPVVLVEIYQRGVKLTRIFKGEVLAQGLRAEISSFTAGSKRRLRWAASNANPSLVAQFGMTYHHANPDGYTAKRHLNAFLMALRRRFKCGYLWILEFQSRGVLHFHLWLTIPADTEGLHEFLATTWNRIAEPGDKEHLRVHEHPRNLIPWDMGSGSYLCKYLDKAAQKAVPCGFVGVGRFWGASRDLVGAPDVIEAADIVSPCAFVRTVCKHHEKAIRRSKWKAHARRSACSYRLPNGAKVARRLLAEQVQTTPSIPDALAEEGAAKRHE